MFQSCVVAALLITCVYATLSETIQHLDATARTVKLGDLQRNTYKSPFKPLELANRKVTLTPIFSPDHSLGTETKIVERARQTLDIAIPSISGFHYCHEFNSTCKGCPASEIKSKEDFPIFAAAVNAVHKGVRVRIVSNKFDDPLCNGEMDLWTYLHFAGAKIRFYTGTSFMHSKYISIDNEVAAVSSINFSKNSLIKNREAGIIMSNDNSGELFKYTQSIFEYDFKHGEEFKPSQQYSKADIDLIRDKTPLPVNTSQHWHFQCKTESPVPRPHAGNHKIGLFASPDHAFGEVIAAVNQTQKSFWISIYEISHPDLCLEIIRLHQRGVEVKIFASNDVFGEKEKEAAHVCYNHLKAAGVKVRLSAPHCLSFSHQKYWIIDDNVLFLSTGNWAPTDYPTPPYEFPPPNSAGWRKTNRDINFHIEGSKSLIDVFKQVYALDYSQGHDF